VKEGDVWEDLEFFERAIEFAPTESSREQFAMLIKQARRRIEDDLIDNFKENIVSAETVKNITGKMIRKMPKREHFQYRRLEFAENEFTSFARKAFKDMSGSDRNFTS
jgi:hypothetical protein